MNKEQLRLINNLKINIKLRKKIEEKEEFIKNIFDCFYFCYRDWEAWQYKTMREDDFEPMNETDGGQEIISELENNLISFIDLLYFFNSLDNNRVYAIDNELFSQIKFYNTKELLEQTEETLRQLNEFLEHEFNI